jgi:hypothetical protein
MNAGNVISLVVATLALTISAVTAWLTLFKRGTVRMTQPTVIYFGPDRGPRPGGSTGYKVFLRSLLYATSKQGRIVECMFVRLRRGETSQNFNIWVYGDHDLTRGSGLFVPDGGVATNHHFLLPADGTAFEFLPGTYTLSVIALLVGDRQHRSLFSTNLEVTPEHSRELKSATSGLYFDWGPDAGVYRPHVQSPATEAPRT